ncbi:MAG: SDR family oxidoreductase [Alphaproteobacteria bacterium]
MEFGIEGKAALVLGGTQGLGFACAQALAEAGCKMSIVGRDAGRGGAAAGRLVGNAHFIAGDLTQAEARASIHKQATALTGPPSILVTNAGGPPPGPFAEQDHDAWLAALELNMLAAIDLSQRVLPAMLEAGFGRIVNITSFAVREPYPNMTLANAVRAGLTGAMSTLAREVAGQDVTVNNILPGLMDTPALQRVYKAQAARENISEDEAKARMAVSVPAGRLGLAEDFGPLCAFLCSRHAGYITGQNITVDGGLVRALL